MSEPTFDGLAVGDVILVKGWWETPQPCRCRVLRLPMFADSKWLSVKPLEGDPHVRSITADEIVARHVNPVTVPEPGLPREAD